MPRNPHPPGTAGVVRVYPTPSWVPSPDDVPSQAEAKRKLAVAVRDRTRPAGAEELTGSARLEDRSPQPRRNYHDRLDNQVIPSLGQLRVRELTVAIVDRHSAAVRDKNGSAIAKL